MATGTDANGYEDLQDSNVPLHALRFSCTERISIFLNQKVQLRAGKRHVPNYGGLGDLIGLDGPEIMEISRQTNPGLATLNLWMERRSLNPTIGNLVKFLNILGRQDILTDTADWIRDEIKAFEDRQNLVIQDETVSTGAEVTEDVNRILTIDDVMSGGRTIYDAYICYDAADLDFVRAMITKLEDPEYGFRFFVPSRNNLGGTNSNALLARIISERCRHMIVVLSSSFLTSPHCEFQASYAFSLNPGARDKKIVPIKIENCRTPDILKIMAFCDFTNQNLLDWSWQRLALSIMCPMPNPDFLGPQRFVPPQGSSLMWGNLGMGELGATGGASRSDSGFFSQSSQSRRGPVTAPVASTSQSSQPGGSRHSNQGQNHTAPVAQSSLSATPPPSNEKRDKTSGPFNQAIKRITQTLAPSKVHKKKHKTTKTSTEVEPCSSAEMDQTL